MVVGERGCGLDRFALSVLALSSRFDGHSCRPGAAPGALPFSTRSVESF